VPRAHDEYVELGLECGRSSGHADKIAAIEPTGWSVR